MPIDCSRLEKPRQHGDKLIARCPACAEDGGDKSCIHLCVFNHGEGAFSCAAYQGDRQHNQRIYNLVGSKALGGTKRRAVARQIPQPVRRYIVNSEIPALAVPTDVQLTAIARQRGWQVELALPALRVLCHRGLLWVGSLYGMACWIVTDSCRFSWRARRMDGQQWVTRAGSTKSIAGGKQLSEWPIGTDTLGRHCYPFVVFCEGEADLLASAVIAHAEGRDLTKIGFVAMLGAVDNIDSLALKEFARKSVVVMRQNDAAHQKSAKTSELWCGQLHRAGVSKLSLTCFDKIILSDGVFCKDAGDFAKTIHGPVLPRIFNPFSALIPLISRPSESLETSQKPEHIYRKRLAFPATKRAPRDGERCYLDATLSEIGEWVFDLSGDTVFRNGLGYFSYPLAAVTMSA